MTTVALGGALAPEDVVGVARAGWKVAFPEEAERRVGAAAVRKCREVLQRVRAVLGIEAVCAAQALDYRAPLRPGRGSAAAHAALRARVPRLEQDRPLSGDFTAALALIEDGSLLAAVEAAVGPLA